LKRRETGRVSTRKAVNDGFFKYPISKGSSMARAKTEPKNNNNGANLGFEAKLFLTADKLRGNMDASEYKHVALGLIFLKYISDAFEAKHRSLVQEPLAVAEDPEEYLAENVFWVPKEARWSHLQDNARQATIGRIIDDAMLALEACNASLKGVLPKDYARPAMNTIMLGELIDLISGIAMGQDADRSKDILGRVYEYFLGGFAGAEGKRGGEFYTPRSVVGVLVEMLEPYKGRVYDPCCGSGGCSCSRKSSCSPTADGSATLPSMDRRATTRPGGCAG
jgi:type I restriction enzyme M protein